MLIFIYDYFLKSLFRCHLTGFLLFFKKLIIKRHDNYNFFLDSDYPELSVQRNNTRFIREQLPILD